MTVNDRQEPAKRVSVRRVAVAALVAAYIAVGAWSGYALKVTMPAVSLAGATYFALTWPTWLKGSPVRLPIPRWCFSFDRAR